MLEDTETNKNTHFSSTFITKKNLEQVITIANNKLCVCVCVCVSVCVCVCE